MSTGRGPLHGELPAAEVDGADLDRALLAAHVAGDPDAFSELVRRHQHRLWAVALRTLGDPDDAADALQDALLSAFRAAAGYRGEAAVTTWLHTVVVNACVDRIRRSRSRRTVPLPETSCDAPARETSEPESHVDVVRALARLPEHQRLAVVLVDLQDMSVAEAADVLGVPVGTVKSRCARGRAALASILGRDDAGQGNQDDRPNVGRQIGVNTKDDAAAHGKVRHHQDAASSNRDSSTRSLGARHGSTRPGSNTPGSTRPDSAGAHDSGETA